MERLSSFNLDDKKLGLLSDFLDYVLEYNKTTNLTAIRNKEEAIVKHLYDCLLLTKYFDFGDKEVLDIGSGAGFPGMVLAIACPDASFTLIDGNGKKTRFLESAVEKFSLGNVKVINGSVEDIFGSFDVVTGRAVAEDRIMLELASGVLKTKGHFLGMLGRNGKQEIEGATKAEKKLGYKLLEQYEDILPEEAGNRIIAIYEKVGPTPKGYPRSYGRIKANPI